MECGNIPTSCWRMFSTGYIIYADMVKLVSDLGSGKDTQGKYWKDINVQNNHRGVGKVNRTHKAWLAKARRGFYADEWMGKWTK